MVSANLVADAVLSHPSTLRSASGPTRLRLADLLHITDRTADDVLSGRYDHVVPPRALVPDSIKPDVPSGEKVYTGFGQYGFRVPTAVISPYARRDYVSHKVMDHTSICSLVEHKWNLPAMTYRDANAWPMLDMLDLRHPAFKTPPKLARPLLDTDHGALKCEKTGPGVIPPPGSVTKPKK